MNTILRCINGRYVEDYDLSASSDDIYFDCFHAYCDNGLWKYRTDRPISVGNEETVSGEIRSGGVFFIDQSMRKAVLVLKSEPDLPRYYSPFETMSIGRSDDNDIVIHDKMVSSHHCVINRNNGEWFVKDLRSTNGTIVNGKFISEQKIETDNVIIVGTVRFTVGKILTVLNYSDKITVSLNEADIADMIECGAYEYPFYTVSPRMISDPGILNVNIESAPSIGEKPSMGVGGIPLSLSMIAVSLGMQALRYSLGKKKYTKLQKQRAELYANYLAGQEALIIDHIQKQKEYYRKIYPTAESCLKRANVMCRDLWERQPDDTDFLGFTLGEGIANAAVNITIPQKRLQMKEDDFDNVPAQIVEKYSKVQDVPITFSLGDGKSCGIVGSHRDSINAAYNMIIQLAALHSYDDVKLVVLFPEKEREYWEWVRFLPHCVSGSGLRYAACTRKQTVPIFEEIGYVLKKRADKSMKWSFGNREMQLPYYVFLIADIDLVYGSTIGEYLLSDNPDYRVSCIYISESLYSLPHNIKSVISLSGQNGTIKSDNTNAAFHGMKSFTVTECDDFARHLAPIRIRKADNAAEHTLPTYIPFLSGMGMERINDDDISALWNSSSAENSLAVPIGLKAGGEPFIFDIHQKAHGPHGLVAGGTGSGKSQMAQTWILSLALHFSPSSVNFILVDFKGESLLQPFEKLPHVAGRISNLDKDVSRSFSALESELVSRQRRLAENGCTDIIEYQKLTRTDTSMEKMPYIILVIDEYAELKQQFPDFAKSLDHLFRGGRSLGMLVVLMTQQPAGVITDQMRANANFSWCLSVRDESDSRAILGVGDAAMIKNPGRAYIKCGDGTFELIQSFYCGATFRDDPDNDHIEPKVNIVELNGERIAVSAESKKEKSNRRTEIEVVVQLIHEYCEKIGEQAKPLWTPELPEVLDLDEALSILAEEIKHGLVGIVGMADDPENQRRCYITHDFETDGNLAVYGMPLSGKTTFLISLIESFCFSYSPDKIWFYIVESGSYRMRSLQSFPHIGAAVGDDDLDTVGRVLTFLSGELERRKKLFRLASASTFASYNEMSDNKLPQIVLVADNLNMFMRNFGEFSAQIIQLSQQGAAYGINLMCSFSGTSGINYQLLQNIKAVFSLELSDKIDYQSVVGRPSVKAPQGIPGRGFVKTGGAPLLFQATMLMPEISDAERDAVLKKRASEISVKFNGELPVRIMPLPETVRFGSVEMSDDCITFGLCIEDTKPVSVSCDKLLSLIISYTQRDIQISVLMSLIKQYRRDKNADISVYTNTSEELSVFEGEGIPVKSYENLDDQIENIANELRKRQSDLKSNAETTFPNKIIILDNYSSLISSVRPNTAARLEVFIRLGKGLGICVIAADTAEKMSSCGYSSNILTATLKQGAKLLIGGRLSAHQIADIYGMKDAHSKMLKSEEGVLICENNTKQIKLMICDIDQ